MKVPLALFAACSLLLTGCAAVNPGSACPQVDTLEVSPVSATADHMATAPGNQQKFIATANPSVVVGCVASLVVAVVHPVWANPDPLDVQISSANDDTNGTATCVGATNGPVTLTASFTGTGGTGTKTATLTCK